MNSFPSTLRTSVESFLYKGASPLYKELTAIASDALAGDGNSVERMAAVIKKRTNLNITIESYDYFGYGAFVFINHIDVNHVLRDAMDPLIKARVGQRVNYGIYSEYLKLSEGTISNHGKVDGVFSRIPMTLIFDKANFDGMFTAEEIAAIVLHEVGHVYGYFAALGRTVISSLAISHTLEILADTTDLEQRTHAVDSSVKVLQLQNVDVSALSTPGEDKTYEAVMVRNVVAKMFSDQGNDGLFNGEAEFVADSFATHSGGGSAVGSALIKLARFSNSIQQRSRKEYLATEAMKAALLALTALNPITLGIGSLIAALCIADATHSVNSRTTTTERLEAVHGDLVSILKDRKLPKKHAEMILNDANFISALRESLTERLTLVGYLWITLSPTHRTTYKQQTLQREIGKLVNNGIFVKAAELKSLVKN